MGNGETDASHVGDVSQASKPEISAMDDARRAMHWANSRFRILERVATGAPIDEVCELLTARAEELFPGSISTVMLLDADGICVDRVYSASLDKTIGESIIGFEIGPDRASCGRAMALGEHVVVEDTQASDLWADFQDLAEAIGIRACWSFPIRTSDGVVRGSMAIFSRQPRAPQAEDLSIIEVHAHFAGIVLDAARSEEARAGAMKQLEHSRKSLASLLESTASLQEVTREDDVLQKVAEAIHSAGWQSVVVCHFDNWKLIGLASVGLTEKENAFIRKNQPSPKQRAEMYGEEFEPYKISRSYFLTAEQVHARESHDDRAFLPTTDIAQPSGEWEPDDVAFVPLYRNANEVIGTISLDNPVDGRRPTIETFQYIEYFADLAARTLERLGMIRRLMEAEERLLLMMRELDHRVRNNLSSLISLVGLMGRTADSAEEMEAALVERIQAMADVHMLLSQSNWRPIQLHELLRAFKPPRVAGDIRFEGVPISIAPRQAGALGMVVHELMMNSVKYGALANDGGSVRVRWTCDNTTCDDPVTVTLSWYENGIAVDPSSISSGLGTKLIEGLVKFELQGRAELRFETNGARHRFVMTLDSA